ncbi:phosphoribosylamine--glycine ligase [Aquimarina sp. ERC-38]|uniref:phosphoribosylamine--glycine ligase n=1 Tax=Aquimarina sp. ERC-38 TaxID=2949996 RepID=UPI00224585BD|nr:phosphoribosylamine--glycine ligase [Aquimarina sp. ERC-38]UZO81886.1 phosphoribosylamine--glycine ligase [Aquimarina sp. ERC-38]
MNILVLGSGGREHTFTYYLSQSTLCTNLYVAPGNAGTDQIAINLPIGVTNFKKIKEAVLKYQIEMVVIGPEDPLVNGIVDFFQEDEQINHVKVIGPSKEGARLEGSKEYAKKFLIKNNIPTAAYQSFSVESITDAKEFLKTLTPPYVLKADGLAAGKGVLILDNLLEAENALDEMLLDKKFGEASSKVVIEEFLDGIELSVFVLTDGKNYQILPTAKDYKRIGEGDTGLNTGGMGAVSPVPFANIEFMSKIEENIVKPTIAGLSDDQIDYKGFIFIGLIKVDNEPKVIEYNVRMGDPETEVVLPRIKNDLVALLESTANQTLDKVELDIDDRSATTVVAVSGGYPEAYQKGKVISGLDVESDSIVFHAGTKQEEENVLTNGGRVLAITSLDNTFQGALKKSYKTLKQIQFENINYRKDIGFDL